MQYDLRAGFHDKEGGMNLVLARGWRGAEAIAFLFHAPTGAGIVSPFVTSAAGVQAHRDQAPPRREDPHVGVRSRQVHKLPVDTAGVLTRAPSAARSLGSRSGI